MNVRGVIPMRRVVNLFGSVGYSLLILGYAMILGGVLLWLTASGSLEAIGVSSDVIQTAPPTSAPNQMSDPSPIALIVMYLIASALLVTIVFVAITLPYWLGRVGSYMIKRSIRFCKIPVTLSSLLTAKLLACAVALVPVGIAWAYQLLELPLSLFQLIILLLATMTFLIQHYLARTSEVVEAKDVW